jgi:pyrroline-5-carboxylate reductase
MQHKVAIIGCGNLGKSIAQGLLDSGWVNPSCLFLTKRDVSGLLEYQAMGVHVLTDNQLAIQDATIVILALKPYTILGVLEELSESLLPNQIIISLATGVTLDQLHEKAPLNAAIYRAMPNTAAHVNKSLTAICTTSTNVQQSDDVKELFEQIGTVIQLDEELMEAVTVLGACGIAYVMRFIRAMVQGGIQIGFSAEMASTIVKHTVNGASELLLQGNTHPETEIDKVTTPKGCTIVGLNEMEHNGFSSSLIKGIVKSYEAIQ